MHRWSSSKTSENIDMDRTYSKRASYSRHKSSSFVMPSLPHNSEKKDNIRTVRIRIVFIRIGDIDTLNEKYQADIYYEARWIDKIKISDLSLEHQTQILNDNTSIRMNQLDGKIFWKPHLFIENAIGSSSEQDKWFTIKRNIEKYYETSLSSIINVTICEHRRLKGMFWEKLELNHFPADVQDLTISISTRYHIQHCELIPDPDLRSSINREAFFDQQEWKLYEHVATCIRQTQEEYSFRDESSSTEGKIHPVLAFTCRAARRPGYYYWNGFCLIFLITLCSFCIFSIPPDLPQSRLQITCTLLLTSVTFRWVVNRSLPTISYLTTLDKYAIISIIMLVILCLWHSIIAAIVFLNPDTASSSRSILPNNIYVIVDRYMFISMFVLYILIHIALIIWLIFVPYKRRREMEFLDREYAEKKHIQIEPTRPRYNSLHVQPQEIVFSRGTSMQGNGSSLARSPIRSINHSDGILMMPNAGTFLPIREEASDKDLNSTQLQEQDDVFYDYTQNQPIEKV